MVTTDEHNWYWSIQTNCSHDELIGALGSLSSPSRQIILEGANKKIAELLYQLSDPPYLSIPSGSFSLRKPKQIAICLSEESINQLKQITKAHVGYDVFLHCGIVDSSHILMEAYDVGSNEVLLSPLLPHEQVEAFARKLKAPLQRELI